MPKLPVNTIIQVAVIIAVVICLTQIIRGFTEERRLERKVEEVSARQQKTVNADSIRSVIEARVMDSLYVILEGRDAKIDSLGRVITKTSRRNEELLKRYNDLRVSLPEF